MRRRAILDPRRLPLTCFLSIVLLLSSFHGVFLTEARFSPEGRWFSRNSGCQDVAVHPQIRVVWGSFCFCCYFSAALFPLAIIGDFRSGIVHCGASAFLPLQSTVVVIAILTTATYPTTFPSSLRSSCSFLRLIFLDPLSIRTRSSRFFLAQKSSLDHAPRRGEGRVIVIELLGAWMTQWFRRQSTSFGIHAFSMHWCFTCFASFDDVISIHNNVQV